MTQRTPLSWDSLSSEDVKTIEQALARFVATSGDDQELALQSFCHDSRLLPFFEQRLCDLGLVDESRLEQSNDSVDQPKIDQLGPIQITGIISKRFTCDVYKGIQDDPQRVVAVKVLHRPDEKYGKGFDREVSMLARLQHPGIAEVFFAGESHEHGKPLRYFVMELVDGPTLTEYATEKGLDVNEKLGLFVKVVDAIGHAHHRAIIHRDLKPTNILVTPAGDPKVLDFGIAMSIDPNETAHTLVGVGTPGYMSPEQFDESLGETTRSDIYSLGVILYQLLSGELPYPIPIRSMLQAAKVIGDAKTVDLRARVPDCPKDLAAIAGKCLRHDPKDRYQNAESLRDDLKRFLAGEVIAARPLPLFESARRLATKHPMTTALALTTLAFLFIGGSVSFLLWRNAESVGQDLARELKRQQRSRINHVLSNADRNWIASPDLVRGWLRDAKTFDGFQDGFAFNVQLHRTRRVIREFKAHANPITQLAFSKDREVLISCDNSGFVHAWNLKTGGRQWQKRFGLRNVRACDVAEDGNRVLIATANTLQLLDLTDGRAIRKKELDVQNIVEGAFSKDGTLAYVWGDGNQIFVCDSELNEVVWKFVTPFKRVLHATMDHTASKLMAINPRGRSVQWNLSDGSMSPMWSPKSRNLSSVAVSSDMEQLAMAALFGELSLYNIPTQTTLMKESRTNEKFEKLSFSHDGQWLVSIGRHRMRGRHRDSQWNINWTRINKMDPQIIEWSANDHSFAIGFENGMVQHCSISPQTLDTTIIGDLVRPMHLRIDQPGDRAIVAGESQIEIDLSTGKVIRHFPEINVPCSDICWHSDGTLDIATAKNRQLLRASTGRSDWVSILNTDRSIRTIVSDDDRQKLLVGFGLGGIAVLRSHDGFVLDEFQAHDTTVTTIVSHPPSGMYASGSENGELAIWDCNDKLVARWQPHTGSVTDLAFTPDGTRLFSASRDCSIGVYSVLHQEILSPLRLGVDRIAAVAVSPDQQTLAFGGDHDTIMLCDAVTGELQAALTGHTDRITDLQFAPNSQTLYSLSLDGTLRGWTPKLSESYRPQTIPSD